MESVRKVTLSKKMYISDVISKDEGLDVELLGWAENIRVHGGLTFINLRDSTGSIQIAIRKNVVGEEVYDKITQLDRESSLRVIGTLRRDPRAPGGVEVSAKSVEIIGISHDFPIRKGVGKKFLLDHRHLQLRRPKTIAVLRIRETAIKGFREWLEANGFVEVQAPVFITAAVEGGATLFPVRYFGKTVYLTQSSQFYLEAAIFAFERVYALEPSFRAEKSRTTKHLTEFWHLEAEVAFANHDDIMRVEEELVYHAAKKIVEERKRELSVLGRDNIKIPEPPYPRITYDEALDLLASKGISIKWGDDLGAESEKVLANSFDTPFFVTKFPVSTRSFYHMPDPQRPEVTLSSDFYVPGLGEITSGGQRIHDLDLLLKKIKDFGLKPEDYEWYLDLRRYGSVPHAGFGLGIERFIKWIAGLPHVRDATMFPRTPTRVYP